MSDYPDQSPHDQYDKEVIKNALRKASGVKKGACEMIGCSRPTLDKYIEKYDDVYEVYYEENETFLDAVEVKLKKIVQDEGHNHHFSAVKFALQTKGKNRGWAIGYETTIHDQARLERLKGDDEVLDLTRLTPEENEQLEHLVRKATVHRSELREGEGTDTDT